MFTNGRKPYGKWPNSVVIEQVASGYVLPCPKKCPPEVYAACIAPCFIYETKLRPTFATLVERFAVLLGEQSQLSEGTAERNTVPAAAVEADDEGFKATALRRDEIQPDVLSVLDKARSGLGWNHGDIDEAEAERRLRLCTPPGTPEGEQVSVHERELFLLREISSLTLIVSVLREGSFGHHAIDYDNVAGVWTEQRPPEGSPPALAKGIADSVRAVFTRWNLNEDSLQPLPKQDAPRESGRRAEAEITVAALGMDMYDAPCWNDAVDCGQAGTDADDGAYEPVERGNTYATPVTENSNYVSTDAVSMEADYVEPTPLPKQGEGRPAASPAPPKALPRRLSASTAPTMETSFSGSATGSTSEAEADYVEPTPLAMQGKGGRPAASPAHPKAHPRSASATPPAYRSDAGQNNALNPFPADDSEEGNSSNVNPPPPPKVNITAHKVAKPGNKRKANHKKPKRSARGNGGGNTLLMDNESEI